MSVQTLIVIQHQTNQRSYGCLDSIDSDMWRPQSLCQVLNIVFQTVRVTVPNFCKAKRIV